MSNICIGLKKTCLGVLKRGDTCQIQWNRFERGRRYTNVNYSAPFAMLALSLLIYLLVAIHRCKSSGRHPLPQGYKYAGYTEGLMYWLILPVYLNLLFQLLFLVLVRSYIVIHCITISPPNWTHLLLCKLIISPVEKLSNWKSGRSRIVEYVS